VIVTVLFLLLIEVQSANLSISPTGATVLPLNASASRLVTAASYNMIRAPDRNLSVCGPGERLQNGKCRVVWRGKPPIFLGHII
jgi:hypothetical protein